jgi:hypothetical protein
MHAPPGRDHMVVLRGGGAGSQGAFICAGALAPGELSPQNTTPGSQMPSLSDQLLELARGPQFLEHRILRGLLLQIRLTPDRFRKRGERVGGIRRLRVALRERVVHLLVDPLPCS